MYVSGSSGSAAAAASHSVVVFRALYTFTFTQLVWLLKEAAVASKGIAVSLQNV
jgi:hypothetical protein